MEASTKLISAIKRFEGLLCKTYLDCAGVPTIGFGHTQGVKMGMTITPEQAENYLYSDLRIVEDEVNGLNVCKTQGQFDALCDFVFNLGFNKLKNSTLLRYIRIHKGNEAIQAQFRRWVYAGGAVQEGLVKRRKWEVKGLVKRREWEAQRYVEED